MRAGLRWGREVVRGLCADSGPGEPTNVMVMPAAGCGKTAIMKKAGKTISKGSSTSCSGDYSTHKEGGRGRACRGRL